MAHRITDKIKNIDQLAAVTARFRSQEKAVVHCHGVFNLIHIDHIGHLQEAKMDDLLMVTVTPDRHVNKDPLRPVFKKSSDPGSF